MLIKVDHIDVKVPDLPAAIEFFTDLGMTVVSTNDARQSVEMSLPADDVIFEIRADPSSDGSYVHHVAFKIDDMALDVQQLKDKGRSFTRESAFIEHTGRTISYLNDPGGAVWQLID